MISKLKITHCNIRSVFKNIAQIQQNIQILDSDVIILTEAWIKKGIDLIPQLPDFKSAFVSTSGNQAGGIVVYVRSHISYLVLPVSIVAVNLEYIVIRLPQYQLNITAIYRHPNNNDFQLHMETLNDIITSKYLNRNDDVNIYLGDININLLKDGYNQKIYKSLVKQHSLKQLINTPTREVNNTKSIVDHVLINKNFVKNCHAEVLQISISDHYPICIHINKKKSTNTSSNKLKLPVINGNFIQMYKNKIQKIDWGILNNYDTSKKFDIFCEKLCEAYLDTQKNFITKKNYCKKQHMPWMTHYLSKKVDHKNFLYRQMKKKNNERSKLLFKMYEKDLKVEIALQKKLYYTHLFEKLKNNHRDRWKILNSMTGKVNNKHEISEIVHNNITIANSHTIANIFASSFLAPTHMINKTHCESSNRSKNSMYLTPVSNSEVFHTITHMKNKNYFLENDIPIILWKSSFDTIGGVLTALINDSFYNGVFPQCLKTSRVIPIFKKNDHHNVQNYRPISVLHTLGKLLEKLFHDRLVQYVEHNNLHYNRQYAYRKGHSCKLAVIDLILHLNKLREKN